VRLKARFSVFLRKSESSFSVAKVTNQMGTHFVRIELWHSGPYNAGLQLKKRKRVTIRPLHLHVLAHVGGLKF
jgi:hypothetical protein